MALQTLHDLYIENLKDLYSAETQLTKALPLMVEGASHPELKRAIQKHVGETERQVERLEQILTGHGRGPRGKHCKGMEGLIEEGSEILDEEGEASVLDAGIIAASQKIEHYEISGYGTAATYAELMGHTEDLALLRESLAEEEQADETLTALAESEINLAANNGVRGSM